MQVSNRKFTWRRNNRQLDRPLQFIITGLLAKGYWNPDNTINVANLRDLIIQSLRVFRKNPLDDYFVSGRIQLPSGSSQKIFIAQNESSRYTAMLPENY